MEDLFRSLSRSASRASSFSARVFAPHPTGPRSSNVVHLSRFCPSAEQHLHPRRMTLSLLETRKLRPCRFCAPESRWLDALRYGSSTLREVLGWMDAASSVLASPATRRLYSAYVALYLVLAKFEDADEAVPDVANELLSRAQSLHLTSEEVADWIHRHDACTMDPPSRSLCAEWDVFAHAEPSEISSLLPDSLVDSFRAILPPTVSSFSVISVSTHHASPLACAFPTPALRAHPGDVFSLAACVDPAAAIDGALLETPVPLDVLEGLMRVLDDSVPLSVRVLAAASLATVQFPEGC